MEPKHKGPRTQINFRIPKDEKTLLEGLAALENRSVGQYLRSLYLKAQQAITQNQKAA